MLRLLQFGYRVTRSGTILICRGGRLVVSLGGATAVRLRAMLETDSDADQERLARATGNYRRGNERQTREG